MVTRALLILCLMLMSQLTLADATASVTRDHIALDESFLLVFDVEGKNIQDPDFSELTQDFKIIGQSSSSTTQIINFERTDKRQWKLHLQAKKAGRLKIPPVNFGQYDSQALYVVIDKEAPAKTNIKDLPIFIETTANVQTAYVQQEIVFTLKLFNAIPGAEPRNIDQLSLDQAIVKTAEPTRYQKSINGVNYAVYEFRYYIYPQETGSLEIPSIKISTAIPQQSQGSSFFRQTRFNEEILRSRKHTIDITPIPQSFQGSTWLPVNDLKITDNLTPQTLSNLSIGDAISRDIIIKAEGTLAEYLPDLADSKVDGLKTYPEKPSYENQTNSSAMSAVKSTRHEILISKAGDYQLPELKINWWNVNTNILETAVLPARKFTVKSSLNSNIDQNHNNNRTSANPSSKQAAIENIGDGQQKPSNNLILYISLAVNFLLLILLILVFIVKKRTRTPSNLVAANENKINELALTKFYKACKNNQPNLARQILGTVARKELEVTSADMIRDNEIIKQIKILDDAIANNQQWDGKNLARAMSQAIEKKRGKTADALQPLYPE